jgi:hypothetical protein
MKLTYIRSSQKINNARTVDLKLLTYHLDSNDAASPISIKLQLVDIPFTILICSHYFRTNLLLLSQLRIQTFSLRSIPEISCPKKRSRTKKMKECTELGVQGTVVVTAELRNEDRIGMIIRRDRLGLSPYENQKCRAHQFLECFPCAVAQI